MTALKEYARLETTALWRPAKGEKRRDVFVSLGDLTIIISDLQNRALAHWSLDAVCRENPGENPARFFPRGNPGEMLEVEQEGMIEAITRLQDTIERSRPHPGRLRRLVIGALLLAVIGFLIFGLPQIIHRHALSVLPPVALRETGQQLLSYTRTMTGASCDNPDALPALDTLSQRLAKGDAPAPLLEVVSEGFDTMVALPGDIYLINRSLIENYDSPDLLAGYLIAEMARAKIHPPMQMVLDNAGVTASLKLLAGGSLPEKATEENAQALLRATPEWPAAYTVAEGFQAMHISPGAYVRAVADNAPESYETIQIIGDAEPVLSDAEWLRLQTICDTSSQ